MIMNQTNNSSSFSSTVDFNVFASNAATRIAEKINGLAMPENVKEIILRLVDWVVQKSQANVNSMLTEFINRQLCKLIDLFELVFPRQVSINDGTEVVPNTSRNFYSRSVLLQAEAEGITPEQENPTPLRYGGQRIQLQPDDRPDVYVDIPDLTTDSLELEVKNLHVQIKIDTQVAGGLVSVCPQVDLDIESASVNLKGLRANAQGVVRLDNIRRVVQNSLETMVKNPSILSVIREARAQNEKNTKDSNSSQELVNIPFT